MRRIGIFPSLTSFLEGVASLLDWHGVLIHREILERTDADAIRSDWEAAGRYLWAAIEEYGEEREEG